MNYKINCVISVTGEFEEEPDSIACSIAIAASKDRIVTYQAIPEDQALSEADQAILDSMIYTDVTILYDRLMKVLKLSSHDEIFDLIKDLKHKEYARKTQASIDRTGSQTN